MIKDEARSADGTFDAAERGREKKEVRGYRLMDVLGGMFGVSVMWDCLFLVVVEDFEKKRMNGVEMEGRRDKVNYY